MQARNLSLRINTYLQSVNEGGIAGATLGFLASGGNPLGAAVGAYVGHKWSRRHVNDKIQFHKEQIAKNQQRLHNRNLTTQQRQLYHNRIMRHQAEIGKLQHR